MGWELVEDHFVGHDKSMAEGFNDDINTLLVFVIISSLSDELFSHCDR